MRTESNNPSYPENPACEYEDEIFNRRVHAIVEQHNVEKPLFLFWAPHVMHGPLQVRLCI